MSGAATIGAAAIGAGTSYMASKKAGKQADAARQSAENSAALQHEASMDQLAFQKQQYDDWQGIFGPIQNNLASYYKNLSSDTIASLGIQNIEREYTRSIQSLDQALAKRGITNSGATTQGLTQLESTRLLGRAEVQTNAPMQAAQQQLGFLSAGLGSQSGLQQGISNSYSNQMNILGQQSQVQLAQAGQYGQQAAAGYANIGSSIGAGINSYLTYQALNPAASVYTQSGAVNYNAGFQGPNNIGVV